MAQRANAVKKTPPVLDRYMAAQGLKGAEIPGSIERHSACIADEVRITCFAMLPAIPFRLEISAS
ncbi:MAG: hypothetical protein J0H18_07470 [Rhizobiales bacterium]|nr:hypothetical protein [Hyphomicrobiales bacterium]OJX99024.1 MAG: hypothetical protein BGP07_02870 [Rhizobiales bacterium 63-22]